MKIKINNYDINSEEIMSIAPPDKYIDAQRSIGIKVIQNSKKEIDPITGFYTRELIPLNQIWGAIYNKKNKNIKYMIVYLDPDKSTFVQNIVKWAFSKGITVFYRSLENCKSGLSPYYLELTKEENRFHRIISAKGDGYIYQGSNYKDTEYKKQKIVPEITKTKLRRYIRYYDLDYPRSETEWYNIVITLKFYIKNKVPTSIDKNRFKICPHCHELVERGFEDEHICYIDEPRKMTHMDYELNDINCNTEGVED